MSSLGFELKEFQGVVSAALRCSITEIEQLAERRLSSGLMGESDSSCGALMI